MRLRANRVWIGFITLALSSIVSAGDIAKCVFLNSYHAGYVWSDGIAEGVQKGLRNQCELITLYMDTKRNGEEAFAIAKAVEIKQTIDNLQPKVVIASDDAAAKYVIQKYYKDSNIPFVFCGVNWTADGYGFPYKNVTGMIEVAPIKELYQMAKEITKGKSRVLYLGANNLTEQKDLEHFSKFAVDNDVRFEANLVSNMEEWAEAFTKANQSYDFIVLGATRGVQDWSDDKASQLALENTKVITLTTYSWMMPHAVLGLTLIPQEQGEWAGNTAKAILSGHPVNDIAITTNKLWDTWVNIELLKASGVLVPQSILRKAKKVKKTST